MSEQVTKVPFFLYFCKLFLIKTQLNYGVNGSYAALSQGVKGYRRTGVPQASAFHFLRQSRIISVKSV